LVFTLGRSSFQRFYEAATTSLYVGTVLLFLNLVLLVPVIAFQSKANRQPCQHQKIILKSFSLLGCWILTTSLWIPIGVNPTIYVLEVFDILLGLYMAFLALNVLGIRGVHIILNLSACIGVVFALGGIASSSARASVLGGGPNVFGRIVAMGCLSLLALALSGKSAFWCMAAAAICTLATILSGSRGALLALALGLMYFFWQFRGRIRKIFQVLIFSFFFLALLINQLGNRFAGVWQERFVQLTFVNHYDASRSILRDISVEAIRERPFTGWGPGSFTELSLGRASYPHNIFLEILVLGGLIGFVILGFGLIQGFRATSEVSSIDGKAITVLSLTALTSAQFSGNLFDSRMIWFYLMVSAFACQCSTRLQKHAVTKYAF